MSRSRTIKQALALSFGRYRYANRKLPNLGANMAALKARNEREAELAERGLVACWKCEQGRQGDIAPCPSCGADATPF